MATMARTATATHTNPDLLGSAVGVGQVKIAFDGPREPNSHVHPTAVAETFPQVHGRISHVSPFFSTPVFGCCADNCSTGSNVRPNTMTSTLTVPMVCE